MSDALLSPAVGATMWAATGAVLAGSARRLRGEVDSARVPLMGVLAAFVFAGQMINFTIPGTGSSGHLGGGIILAALLGPPAAFIAMASILTVQALFFADGGLLALGCNIFNLGFFPAFVAYPLLFRPLLGKEPSAGRITAASVTAAAVGLQLGALGVILQTTASGIVELPFRSFTVIVLPIHLAIGIVEGLVTAAVVSFVWRARPEVLSYGAAEERAGEGSLRKVAAVIAAAAIIVGGGLSWFASSRPDGLEWSIGKTAGTAGPGGSSTGLHDAMDGFRDKTALLPDYGFRRDAAPAAGGPAEEAWPSPSAGTSLSGIVGGLLTLILAGGIGLFARKKAAKP